jgi:PHD/YefM family antitoxin component YafN of YafNO toxin-antitoxin module
MEISIKAIVSNSEMIKNYKECREKAERLGKIFILKNNQPDAVLFSITEYERLSALLEHQKPLSKRIRPRPLRLSDYNKIPIIKSREKRKVKKEKKIPVITLPTAVKPQ